MLDASKQALFQLPPYLFSSQTPSIHNTLHHARVYVVGLSYATVMKAFMAATASPSCDLSSSVALGFVRSSWSTCCESQVSGSVPGKKWRAHVAIDRHRVYSEPCPHTQRKRSAGLPPLRLFHGAGRAVNRLILLGRNVGKGGGGGQGENSIERRPPSAPPSLSVSHKTPQGEREGEHVHDHTSR